MRRKIIQIDQSKCSGCAQCVLACREGALGLEGGKAKLMREDHCDGLGQCLPVCLEGAISFIEKDFPELYDSLGDASNDQQDSICPGSTPGCMSRAGSLQWPLQLKLVPSVAGFYQGANLLIAADCSAYTYPKFQEEFMQDTVRVIACPKLDGEDYREKLAEIISSNEIASLTVTRIEVPCCDGIDRAARQALKMSEKSLPLRSAVFSVEGNLIYDGE